MKRLFCVLLCVCMTALMFAGCTDGGQPSSSPSAKPEPSQTTQSSGPSEPEKPEKLVMYSDSVPAASYQKVAQRFEEKYGIKIEFIIDSYANLHDKIVAAAAGGSQADIGRMDSCWPAEFKVSGIAAPLDEYVTDEFLKTFLPATIEQMTIDGSIMAIPYSNESKWIYYNEAMLKEGGYPEFPKTWEEVKEMCGQLVKKGTAKYGTALSLSQSEGLICEYAGILKSFGGAWKDQSGAWTLNSENSVAAVGFLTDSMKDGFIDPASITYDDTAALNSLMAKDVIFTTSWSGNAASLEEDGSPVKGQIKVACIPGTKQFSTTGGGTTGGGGTFVFASSQNKYWAYKYLELSADEQSQYDSVIDISNIPVTKDTFENAELLKEKPQLETMAPQFDNVLIRPILSDYNSWSTLMQQHLHSALTGAKSPKDALDAAQADITAQIK